MVRVKICGITGEDDARAAVDAGADALGFVFYRPSPRYISPEDAAEIADSLPPLITTVGLFVNESPELVNRVMAETGFHVAQLHGDESPLLCREIRRPVIKAIRVAVEEDLQGMESYNTTAYLLDAQVGGLYGGTGKAFPWELARSAKKYGRIILAGGLTPENTARAIRLVRPYAVDVSSGVESAPGRKDHHKIEKFIKEAKDASSS